MRILAILCGGFSAGVLLGQWLVGTPWLLPLAGALALLGLSSLGLAHLGDSVFEIMVRAWLCLGGKSRVKDLHRATVRYVAAPAQAARFARIAPLLDEEENAVFRRGRNTAPHSVPKAASRGEYQTATGLEALFGWLYLQGRTDRLNQLFAAMMEGEDPAAPLPKNR